MTDKEVGEAQARLDAALPAASPNAGIRFGSDLYAALSKKGDIVVRNFVPVGLSEPKMLLPTYRDHYAFMDINEAVDGFTIGK